MCGRTENGVHQVISLLVTCLKRGSSRGHIGLRLGLVVGFGPIAGINASLEELLVGVLLPQVELGEASLGELLDDELVTGQKLLFGVARVEDKCFVLCAKNNICQSRGSRKQKRKFPALTQSPPSIVRALYMPTAATRLDLARKNL